MPNYCNNFLIITSKNPNVISRIKDTYFVREHNEEKFDFEKIVPYPQHQLDLDNFIDSYHNWQKGWDLATSLSKNSFNLSSVNLTPYPEFTALPVEYQKRFVALAKTCWEEDECFGWYEWRKKCWGTKWNSLEAVINADENEITIYFDTAWCPPLPIIDALTNLEPKADINLIYYEPGSGFAGKYANGDDTPCELGDELYKEIAIEYFGVKESDFEDEE